MHGMATLLRRTGKSNDAKPVDLHGSWREGCPLPCSRPLKVGIKKRSPARIEQVNNSSQSKASHVFMRTWMANKSEAKKTKKTKTPSPLPHRQDVVKSVIN